MAWDGKLRDWLFRRTPNWDAELARDRHPFNYLYTNMYDTQTWPSFTGAEHTYDIVHVTRPNDDGCWEEIALDECNATDLCAPSRKNVGWGTTRRTYVKYHQDYTTPPLCFDKLRHVEMARAQLAQIVNGLKKMPDQIVSDFLRLLSIRQADYLHICGASLGTVTVSDAIFTNNCKRINLGGVNNLPTSKLTMEYLDNHVEELMLRGYHDMDFMPTGKFGITMDIQTGRELANKNPALAGMYQAADFAKGGKYYAYGVMGGVGNWMFKIDSTPMRFQHVGAGVLERVWPYENVAATTGLKPEFSTDYKNAEYQAYHVYNRAARQVFVGDITPVNPDMKFSVARSLMGKWSFKSPDYFKYRDPNTGTEVEFMNDKGNYGYFLGEYEMGAKTVYPEIEMIIIAKREPQCVVDVPRCAASPAMIYQSLTPYNTLCPIED